MWLIYMKIFLNVKEIFLKQQDLNSCIIKSYNLLRSWELNIKLNFKNANTFYQTIKFYEFT